jgi:hypothetical protein
MSLAPDGDLTRSRLTQGDRARTDTTSLDGDMRLTQPREKRPIRIETGQLVEPISLGLTNPVDISSLG